MSLDAWLWLIGAVWLLGILVCAFFVGKSQLENPSDTNRWDWAATVVAVWFWWVIALVLVVVWGGFLCYDLWNRRMR